MRLATQYVKWSQDMASGNHDEALFIALGNTLALEGAVVWDVGAHIGYHSLTFAALVGQQGRVIAFEPNDSNLTRLREHLDANPGLASRIQVHALALSDTDGPAVFVSTADIESGRSSGSHLCSADPPLPAQVYSRFSTHEIMAASADTLISRGVVPSPSLMKLDVEGAEYLVLRGARRLLATGKPSLLIEVHSVRMMFYVHKLLSEVDYSLDIVDEEHCETSRCFVLAKAK